MMQKSRLEELPAAPGRVPGLDGLRAVSISFVLLGHFFLPGRGGFAALGVYLFFGLSGFLITRLMFLEQKANGSISVIAFYARRVRRLYPVLVAFLIAVTVVAFVVGISFPAIEVWAALLYFANYLQSYLALHQQELVLPIGPLWSLSVEEHFYIVMPLFFVFARGRPKLMLYFAIAAGILPLLIRIAMVFAWPEIIGKSVTYHNTEMRIDSIAMGVLIACLCEMKSPIVGLLARRWIFFAAIALFMVSAVAPTALYRETLRYSLINVSCIPIICGLVFGERLQFAQWIANIAPVTFIGRISYSLYIWHQGAGYFLKVGGIEGDDPATGAAKLVLTFILAIGSYFLIEQPFIRAIKLNRFARA